MYSANQFRCRYSLLYITSFLSPKVARKCLINQPACALVNNEPCDGIQIDMACDADEHFQDNFSWL